MEIVWSSGTSSKKTEESQPGQMLQGCERVWTEVESVFLSQLRVTKNMNQRKLFIYNENNSSWSCKCRELWN